MTVTVRSLLQKNIILDACSIYSLYATGQFEAILKWLPGQVYVASYVGRVEVKQLYNPDTSDFDIPVDLSRSKNDGLLIVIKPKAGVESQDAVNFAFAMSTQRQGKNTGEAISGAIAKSRNWTMVTDDVEATKFLTGQGLGSNLTITLHVIECWSNSNNMASDDVKQCLALILAHARYGPPPKAHPLRAWWFSFNIKP